MNHLKTFTLLAALTALFVGAGYLVGGPSGMAIALVLAAGMNLFSYWNADKVVLRMYGAQAVDESHPDARVRALVCPRQDELMRLVHGTRRSIGARQAYAAVSYY